MATLTTSSSFTLNKGAIVQFCIGGNGTAIVDPTGLANAYAIGSQESFLGPYDRNHVISVNVKNGPIEYYIDSDGSIATGQIVISTDAPSDTDGRPDGTIYLQVA